MEVLRSTWLLVVVFRCALLDQADFANSPTWTHPLGCNGTVSQSGEDDTNGYSCPEVMMHGDHCSRQCRLGLKSVGKLYCFAGTLLGEAACVARDRITVSVTRILGSFKLAATRRWTSGGAGDFRNTLREALAESVVILTSEVRTLTIRLISPAGGRWQFASDMNISYEILLSHDLWDGSAIHQIYKDLRDLGQNGSTGRNEFIEQMGSKYPVVFLEVTSEPIMVEDMELPKPLPPLEGEADAASDNSVALILGLAGGIACCCCCCYVTRRKALKRQMRRQCDEDGKKGTAGPVTMVSGEEESKHDVDLRDLGKNGSSDPNVSV